MLKLPCLRGTGRTNAASSLVAHRPSRWRARSDLTPVWRRLGHRLARSLHRRQARRRWWRRLSMVQLRGLIEALARIPVARAGSATHPHRAHGAGFRREHPAAAGRGALRWLRGAHCRRAADWPSRAGAWERTQPTALCRQHWNRLAATLCLRASGPARHRAGGHFCASSSGSRRLRPARHWRLHRVAGAIPHGLAFARYGLPGARRTGRHTRASVVALSAAQRSRHDQRLAVRTGRGRAAAGCGPETREGRLALALRDVH